MGDFYSFREGLKASSIASKLAANPVAYFCMEFSLPQNLPIYAGGLGVLAGDYIMEAYQQSFPMVGVGIFYSEKCYIGEEGGYCTPNDPLSLGFQPVNDKLGHRVFVQIPIEDRQVTLQAWQYSEGIVPLFLMDGNIEENTAEDRDITRLLYTADPEIRLKQELVLGIGGARLLEALGVKPSIYHMNEGHSAFLAFELASRVMRDQGLTFEKAYERIRHKIAFTNHTLVVGGHDVFSNKLVSKILKGFIDENGISQETIAVKGGDSKNKNVFSATFLALNSAGKINAVSHLHAKEARKLWPDYNTEAVTNGVNIQRWDAVGSSDIHIAHRQSKIKLLQTLRQESGVKWNEKDLIVSWARRIVSYKRPTALFEDMARIKKLLNDRRRPLRLVFSGNPHYHDNEGIWLLNYLRKLAKNEFRGKMTFVEKYDVEISSQMISGSDVWLNTPIVGLEACGTSGMKAALNGVIPCSTDDGWLPEVDLDKIGFKLDDKYITLSLLDTLSDKIVPLYYEYQKSKAVDSVWSQKMMLSREEVLRNFGSDRMLKDYIEKVYAPILANG